MIKHAPIRLICDDNDMVIADGKKLCGNLTENPRSRNKLKKDFKQK